MQTLRLAVEPGDLGSEASLRAIARAAEILRAGGTVAFPTETVYGLGANALDEPSVRKIFEAKGRPNWDSLIVHIGERALLGKVAESASDVAMRMMDRFWPGPLTLLLPKHPGVPELVTAGLQKVGVRMPAHLVAQALLVEAGFPVAAPSANRFGHTSATSAAHVAEDLEGRIDAILDGGETAHGVESTVVDVRDDYCVIYRPGVITAEQIEYVSGCRVTFRTEPGQTRMTHAAPAPGMGERHYAPQARLVLVEGPWPVIATALADAVKRCVETGDVVGVLLPDGFSQVEIMVYGKVHTWHWGPWENPEELAHRLYAGLRWLDHAGATAIVCPLPEPVGIGVAIRDRLQRAAKRG